ncbi:hypothetical protein C5S31_10500 [ANME-1 cluster archaeon GoMg2]|nr:hypothetical protein [ANME-1 cluster archaeon GoMg2]
MPIAVSSGIFVRFQTTPMHSADTMLNGITPSIWSTPRKLPRPIPPKAACAIPLLMNTNSLHNYIDADNAAYDAG